MLHVVVGMDSRLEYSEQPRLRHDPRPAERALLRARHDEVCARTTHRKMTSKIEKSGKMKRQRTIAAARTQDTYPQSTIAMFASSSWQITQSPVRSRWDAMACAFGDIFPGGGFASGVAGGGAK